jgi:ABC-type antimicrobial peptide transport system permease subunit
LSFVRWGLVLSAIAIPPGVAASATLARLMSALLFGVRPLDAVTYAAVVGVLSVAAAAASYLPARRILSLEPVRALNS